MSTNFRRRTSEQRIERHKVAADWQRDHRESEAQQLCNDRAVVVSDAEYGSLSMYVFPHPGTAGVMFD